ncbi:ABC-type phosphonate transport system, ATPase component [Pleurocapsa sp. PCC 7327]|uniref:ATP-binding cassette domain-containing protein n=1 Tax=Pleurocapsa sp. PCC 7327 TaxID=118163 RepID=UPI00029FB4FA|nr:ATP-binding cassette domain-containing protein [Pleurocapsa sp. PCC 7327]AFY78010.1 ABC-type phosphonate transport system, ATPase component [Pleurocapsa sp. PCC 7327]MCH9056044.1 ATP-binding cassette domain-containing protein [Synechococcus sp. PCC 6716]
MQPLLDVCNLTKIYGAGCPHCLSATGATAQTNICPHCGSLVAMQEVSFSLYPGEILGIMGESGSGKSTLVKTLYLDQLPTAGTAVFRDGDEATETVQSYDLFSLNGAQQRWLQHHKFGMVYQNPHLGLNFRVSAGGNIAERLLMADLLDYSTIRDRARTLLERTEILPERMDELPSDFSGGMQQRVQIARALATNPPLLFLDEVTTGLDLSVQAKILDLILEIQQQLGVAMIVVTHDLGVIRLLTTRTLVMKYGQVVEAGLTDQVLEDPQHAYTQQLVASAL